MSCTVLVTGCGGSAVVLSNSAATRSSGCPAAFAELAGDLADRLAGESIRSTRASSSAKVTVWA